MPVRRRGLHIFRFRQSQKLTHSVAPPFQTAPATLGCGLVFWEAVAHLATQKFVMGSPLYRQEQEWNRKGLMLSRQTMSNWLLRCAEDWLKPVYDVLKAHLVQHDLLHADETELQVLHEDGKKAQTKSYMWLYRTSGDAAHPVVLYEYQPSRSGDNPKAFLKGFHGYLQTDAYLLRARKGACCKT